MTTKTSTNWVKGMAFDAEISGHHLTMDADSEWGGQDLGPRPKPLLLAALAGCTGMDVVSILDKMKVGPYTFRMDIEADSTEEHPIVYKEIRLSYIFGGEALPQDKIMKAVKLSFEQYCGVSAMLKKAMPVSIKVFINEKEVQL